MKKRITYLFGLLVLFNLIAFTYGDSLVANASVFRSGYKHYNDIVNGTSNLNNANYNNANIGDNLEEPENGWSRYDNSNTNITYTGSEWIHENLKGYKNYKNTRSFNRSDDTATITLSVYSKKIRLIGLSGPKSAVFIDGKNVGNINPTYKNALMFEYEMQSLGNHTIKIVIDPSFPDNDSFISLDAIDICSDENMMPTSKNVHIIENIYHNISNNKIDSSELNFWSNKLTQNGLANVAKCIITNNIKVFNTYNTNTKITILFMILYDRIPTVSEVTFWTNELEKGRSISSIISELSNSSEYEDYCKKNNLKTIPIYYTDNSNVVKNLYKNINKRPVNNNELSYWEEALYNDGILNVVYNIMNSDEIINKNYSNKEKIEILFIVLTGREPDVAGLNYWTNELNFMNNLPEIINRFSQSEECKKYLKKIDVKVEPIKYDNNYIVVKYLYSKINKRNGKNDEISYWANRLANDGILNVVYNILNSDEIINKNYNNKEKIEILFRVLAGREPDVAGLNYWTNELNFMNNLPEIINRFSQSEECKKYLKKIDVKVESIKYDNNYIVVKYLYSKINKRNGKNDEISYWANRLANDGILNVTYEIINSDEIKNKHYNNRDIVSILFIVLIGREPDTGGLDYWTNQLNNGSSLMNVINRFSEGEECKKYFETIHVKHINLDINSDLIKKLYRQINKREPGNDELLYWSNRLSNFGLTDVVNGIMNSNEIKNKHYSNKEKGELLFRTLVGREPDAGGLNFWTNQLNNGDNLSNVIHEFSNCDEYRDYCSKIGVKQ